MPTEQDLEKAQLAVFQTKKREYLGKLRSYHIYLPPKIHADYFHMLDFVAAQAEVKP